MKIVHVMADGTKRDSVDGLVIRSESFYQVLNKIMQRRKEK